MAVKIKGYGHLIGPRIPHYKVRTVFHPIFYCVRMDSLPIPILVTEGW
jgi:hypothetical protein